MQSAHTPWTPTELTAWANAIHAGQVCAAPAEGVYGYVANPFNPTALHGLLEIKQRNPTKGFITLIGNLSQLTQLCPPLSEACDTAIATYWQPHQAPTTLILPALPELPELLTGGMGTIAVRLSSTDYIQTYMQAAGTPLVSTSLNISGQPPATAAEHIAADIPALLLPQPLSGTSSRIFAPLENKWIR